MVSTVTPYTLPRNRAFAGEGYDGVVRVSVGGSYGTGVLLYDGHAVLTAAHLFNKGSTAASVYLETTAGSQTLGSKQVAVHPQFDSLNGNHDLALFWLAAPAPVRAERYSLYRSNDEIGQTLTMVGYGKPGTGSAGVVVDYAENPLRLKASNQFDADAATLKDWLGAAMSWTPVLGTQLVADFDNGTNAQDALGLLINRPGTGLGQDEGLIAPGDSGGPAFIKGEVAGIASYTASMKTRLTKPDIDSTGNSSFGEIAAWQRLSTYQQWIDQSLRAQYPSAPTKPEEVKKSVPEGHSSTSYAYFLLQFTGVRSDAQQFLSVDYATRDGSATAGTDYLATHGTLVLYPNENQAAIPVEILGDYLVEPDETFYLDVTRPVGGSFGTGVVTLTAVKIIYNDDFI
jgi:secreted trypsin-like serine protease